LCLTIDDYVVVLGVGGLGHLAVQLASHLYRPLVIAVDVRDEALRLSREVGADFTVNASRQNFANEVRRITGGAGADAVIDFVTTSETSFSAFSAVRRGGRLVLVGLSGDYSKFILPLVAMRGVTIAGSYVGSLEDLMELKELLGRGVLRTVTATMALKKVNEAISMIREKKAVGRIILKP